MFTLLIFILIAIAVIGGLSIVFMFISKNEKIQNISFYAAAVTGIFTAFLSATSGPSNLLMPQIIAWCLGFLSLVAIILKLKIPQKPQIAKLAVSASLILGFIYLLAH